MTIAVNLAVPEGIIFAADSRQTYKNARGDIRVSSDYGQKLFQLGPSLAGVTYGWAFLMGRNIHSHVNDYSISLSGKILSVEEMAKGLGKYLTDQYNTHIEKKYDQPVAEGSYALALLVGGYDAGSKTGQVYEVYVPSGETFLVRSTDEKVGISWRGDPAAITRLLKGYDPRVYDLKGFTPELQKEIEEAKLDYLVDYWAMPLQDGIDLATFLVHLTIQTQRFSDGIGAAPGASATCGGPIDLAVMQPGQGLQWIQVKALQGERPTAAHSASET